MLRVLEIPSRVGPTSETTACLQWHGTLTRESRTRKLWLGVGVADVGCCGGLSRRRRQEWACSIRFSDEPVAMKYLRVYLSQVEYVRCSLLIFKYEMAVTRVLMGLV